MKEIDKKLNLLAYEINNLSNIKNIDDIKKELKRDLNKMKSSTDTEYISKNIDIMFMRIDCIKKLPKVYQSERGNITATVLDVSTTKVVDSFSINSLITTIIVDSFSDIKYIYNNKNSLLDKSFNEIIRKLTSSDYKNDIDKLKEVFNCRIKLLNLKDFVEEQTKLYEKLEQNKLNLIKLYKNKIENQLSNMIYYKHNISKNNEVYIMNDYEINFYNKLQEEYKKINKKSNNSLTLYKLENLSNKCTKLYNYVSTKKDSNANLCNDAINDITLKIISELKSLKKSLPHNIYKYYDSFVEELKTINETMYGVNKYIQLEQLLKNIYSVKMIIFEKNSNIDDKHLYDYIYNYYFNKLDSDLAFLVIENIQNKDAVKEYNLFKEKIKTDKNEDINSLIEKIIILQNMHEKIKLNQKILIKK